MTAAELEELFSSIEQTLAAAEVATDPQARLMFTALTLDGVTRATREHDRTDTHRDRARAILARIAAIHEALGDSREARRIVGLLEG